MATALVSALTGVPTRDDVAMTGEITLLGNVLPIGGLNEKAVAAARAGVKTVIIPKQNEKDLKELPEFLKKAVQFRLVETMDQVLEIALNPSESRSTPRGPRTRRPLPPRRSPRRRSPTPTDSASDRAPRQGKPGARVRA